MLAIASYAMRPKLRPDDRIFSDAVADAGLVPAPVVWDGDVDWGRFGGCVLRSASDYYGKWPAFLAWLREVGALMPLWNSADQVIWNADKTYLRELAEEGVPTIPTHWIERGAEVRLDELLEKLGWADAVVKPTMDVGAKSLQRVRRGRPGDQEKLGLMLARQGIMVQPFLDSVVVRGETSLVFIDSTLTHVVRKRPKPGDFRVQGSWGGGVELAEASAAELAVAEAVMAGLRPQPLYARVDLVAGPAGRPCLIELELIEPILYFEQNPAAAARLATAIASRLT